MVLKWLVWLAPITLDFPFDFNREIVGGYVEK